MLNKIKMIIIVLGKILLGLFIFGLLLGVSDAAILPWLYLIVICLVLSPVLRRNVISKFKQMKVAKVNEIAPKKKVDSLEKNDISKNIKNDLSVLDEWWDV